MFQENRLLEWMDAIDNIAVMRKGIRNKKLKKEIEENLKLILPGGLSAPAGSAAFGRHETPCRAGAGDELSV